MDIWVVLGIEMTKDEDAINAAYREKLQLVHPEEHPEEFMQLRAAYDEALKYARQSDEGEAKEKTSVDLWIDRVKEVYESLPRRVDLEEWKALLNDDVCQGIDSRMDARDALLAYCMECFYLPCYVWQYFEDVFSFKANREELYERFPRDYIDSAVIGGTDGDPVVPYELFARDFTGNPDSYIRLYLKARSERRSRELEASAATLEDMKKSGVEHPYTRLAEAELLYMRDENEPAWEMTSQLLALYPEDTTIRLIHGEIARNYKNDYEAALADYQTVLDKWGDHNQGLWGKAECLYAMEKLEEAKDVYLRLHQRIPFDDSISKRIEEINQKLVERYEQSIADNPDDFELRMDYAWSCLQRREHDKVKALLAEARPNSVSQQADFENISTKLYLNCEECEEGLRHAQEWEKLIPALPEGETEEEKKRKGKLPEILYLQAAALGVLERYDEAIEVANRAEAADPTKVDPIDVRRRAYYRRREYDKAVAEAKKMVEMEPSYVHWFALGYDQYAAGDKAEAYRSFGEALEYGRVLQAYIYRVRILCDFDEWEGVKSSIQYLEENGVESDQDVMRYLKARVLHSEDKKDEALTIYKDLIKKIEADESQIDFAWEVYHKAADIEDDNGMAPEEVIAIVDKGLETKEDDLALLDLKSYLLWKAKRLDEQMELNKRIIEFYPNHRAANERIGDVLYDHHGDYEGAMEYYLRQERLRDSAALQEVMGLCLMYLERNEEAEPHFRKAIEMEPERLRPRANLGLLHERQFDFEGSLPYQKENVRINLEQDKKDKRCYRWLARTLSRLRRYDEAMEAYRKNLELYGEDEDARHVVEVCMESGRFDMADKLLEQYHAEGKITEKYLPMKADITKLRGKNFIRFVKKMEDGDEKTHRLADICYEQGKYLKALEYFKKLDELDPDAAAYSTVYIKCLRELGRTEERKKLAERNLRECVYMEKQAWRQALYITHRAFVLLANEQPEEAKPLIDRALKMPMCDHCRYSKCKDAIGALAQYYEQTGDYQKALEAYREGLEIAPDDLDFAGDIKRVEKELKKK